MLARNTYPQEYIVACRLRVESQLAAFRKLAAAKSRVEAKETSLDKAFESLESAFFNNMIIVLDSYFVHRTRAIERKDCNPLNEVRVLANSMMQNNETMMADSTIKMNAAKSVLKYEVGDRIRMDMRGFSLLYKAFFAEIESKFAA